ncbi:MAG: zinc ribbon domain-containing protein [Clostridia bacterium]|nr:zinc ribbon domain-containing protein [Clostridia bacterium]
MKCPNCGNEIGPNDLQCRYCSVLLPHPVYATNYPSGKFSQSVPQPQGYSSAQLGPYYTGSQPMMTGYYGGYAPYPKRWPEERPKKRDFSDILVILLSLHVILDVLIIILLLLNY